MSLIKTSALNSVAVTFRMLSLLGINKVMAIYVGPVGYALVGQFYNAVQMITTFASGAINLGVVRYTAEHAGDEALQRRIWQTSGSIALIGSLIGTLFIVGFNRELALYFLKDESLGDVFVWFGAALTFFVFNTLLLAILNGKKEVKKYVIANISGSIISFGLTLWLAIKYELFGSLVALGIYQSIAFIVTFGLCVRSDWFSLKFLFGRIDKGITLNLLRYTLMAVTTAVVTPLCHILIRNFIGKQLSWEFAGYWEALWKFSSAYLLFLTSTLSLYYLPRISEIKSRPELRGEIVKCFKLVVPAAILMSLFIFFLRHDLIGILFTRDFHPVADLFFWQLVGDTLKISSWIFSYVFAARGFMWLYVTSEVLFNFLFFGFVVLLVPEFDLQGAALAHALTYFLYLLFVVSSLKVKRII